MPTLIGTVYAYTQINTRAHTHTWWRPLQLSCWQSLHPRCGEGITATTCAAGEGWGGFKVSPTNQGVWAPVSPHIARDFKVLLLAAFHLPVVNSFFSQTLEQSLWTHFLPPFAVFLPLSPQLSPPPPPPTPLGNLFLSFQLVYRGVNPFCSSIRGFSCSWIATLLRCPGCRNRLQEKTRLFSSILKKIKPQQQPPTRTHAISLQGIYFLIKMGF